MSATSGAARRRKKKEQQAEAELFLFGAEDVPSTDNILIANLATEDAGDTGVKLPDHGRVGSPTDTGSEGRAYGQPAVLKPQPKAIILKRLRQEKEAEETKEKKARTTGYVLE